MGLALVSNPWIAGVVIFAAGLAWIGMLTSLNVAAQMASPGWVKARALAVYLLVFQGVMTSGSVLWGSVATSTSVATALLVAAVGQGIGLLIAFRWCLPRDSASDLAPSSHWAERSSLSSRPKTAVLSSSRSSIALNPSARPNSSRPYAGSTP